MHNTLKLKGEQERRGYEGNKTHSTVPRSSGVTLLLYDLSPVWHPFSITCPECPPLSLLEMCDFALVFVDWIAEAWGLSQIH